MADIFTDGAKIEFRSSRTGDHMLALVDGKAIGEVEGITPAVMDDGRGFGAALVRVYLRNVTFTFPKEP
jgi:hypothetical protein